MARDNFLETLSGRATRGKNPSVCPIGTTEVTLPDTLRTRCGSRVQNNLNQFEQGRPDEG